MEEIIPQNVTLRRCSYCRELGHREPNCAVSQNYSYELNATLCNIRNTDISNNSNGAQLTEWLNFQTKKDLQRLVKLHSLNAYRYNLWMNNKVTSSVMITKDQMIETIMYFYYYDYIEYQNRYTALIREMQEQLDQQYLREIEEQLHLVQVQEPQREDPQPQQQQQEDPQPQQQQQQQEDPKKNQVVVREIKASYVENNESFDCPICIESIEGTKRIQLECNHNLCKSCFNNYLAHIQMSPIEPKCSICRRNIKEIKISSYF